MVVGRFKFGARAPRLRLFIFSLFLILWILILWLDYSNRKERKKATKKKGRTWNTEKKLRGVVFFYDSLYSQSLYWLGFRHSTLHRERSKERQRKEHEYKNSWHSTCARQRNNLRCWRPRLRAIESFPLFLFLNLFLSFIKDSESNRQLYPLSCCVLYRRRSINNHWVFQRKERKSWSFVLFLLRLENARGAAAADAKCNELVEKKSWKRKRVTHIMCVSRQLWGESQQEKRLAARAGRSLGGCQPGRVLLSVRLASWWFCCPHRWWRWTRRKRDGKEKKKKGMKKQMKKNAEDPPLMSVVTALAGLLLLVSIFFFLSQSLLTSSAFGWQPFSCPCFSSDLYFTFFLSNILSSPLVSRLAAVMYRRGPSSLLFFLFGWRGDPSVC